MIVHKALMVKDEQVNIQQTWCKFTKLKL